MRITINLDTKEISHTTSGGHIAAWSIEGKTNLGILAEVAVLLKVYDVEGLQELVEKLVGIEEGDK